MKSGRRRGKYEVILSPDTYTKNNAPKQTKDIKDHLSGSIQTHMDHYTIKYSDFYRIYPQSKMGAADGIQYFGSTLPVRGTVRKGSRKLYGIDRPFSQTRKNDIWRKQNENQSQH